MYVYVYVCVYIHTYIHRGEEEERRGWSRAVALERSLLNYSLVLKDLTSGPKVSTAYGFGSVVPMNTQMHHTLDHSTFILFLFLRSWLLAVPQGTSRERKK